MEIILMTFFSGLVVLFLVAPWVALVVMPFFAIGSFLSLAVGSLFFKNTEFEIQHFREVENFRAAINKYTDQWHKDVRTFGRVTQSRNGRISLILQFRSGDQKWTRYAEGSDFTEAIAKMSAKFLNRPMPIGNHRSYRFDHADRIRWSKNFEELFPEGIQSYANT